MSFKIENCRLATGTKNCIPCVSQYREEKNQGIPKPREAVKAIPDSKLRRGRSAVSSPRAAIMTANRWGILRPIEMRRRPLTLSLQPMKHPRELEISRTRDARMRIAREDIANATYPPKANAGGMKAAISFQGKVKMWTTTLMALAPPKGCRLVRFVNCCSHIFQPIIPPLFALSKILSTFTLNSSDSNIGFPTKVTVSSLVSKEVV
eukprot:GFUD01001304.1.p2 GENE.GFUD01001304.1~~GFUD01001304.1.p2  ORF type:complete len:207 (+),score=32.48 GFUD01001304.1:305-925(+)